MSKEAIKHLQQAKAGLVTQLAVVDKALGVLGAIQVKPKRKKRKKPRVEGRAFRMSKNTRAVLAAIAQARASGRAADVPLVAEISGVNTKAVKVVLGRLSSAGAVEWDSIGYEVKAAGAVAQQQTA